MQFIIAFVVGGAICGVCQLAIDVLGLTPAKLLISLFIIGATISVLGWFEPLSEFAGAGVTVPLLGFGNLMMQGVQKAVKEIGLLGVLSGGISAASVGICTSILFAVIAAIFSHSHAPK